MSDQIDVNQLSNALQTKADRDLSNINNTNNAASTSLNTAGIRTVIGTYSNNGLWYRLWSDGWKEEGGMASGTLSGSTVIFTVTFPLAFTDIRSLACEYRPAQGYGYQRVTDISQTSFTYQVNSASGNYQTNNYGITFYACGW